MTLEPWIARTLRRSLLLTGLVLGTQELLHRALHPRPELPPARVDRMVVWAPDGSSREIADSAAVARIVAFVRARSAPTRVPEHVHPSPLMPSATFYRGTVKHGWIAWNGFVLMVPAGDHVGALGLSRAEAAELQRLMGAGAPPSGR